VNTFAINLKDDFEIQIKSFVVLIFTWMIIKMVSIRDKIMRPTMTTTLAAMSIEFSTKEAPQSWTRPII
jgi:hypothetical protein